jgi:lysophospholipase L1-like esterase
MTLSWRATPDPARPTGATLQLIVHGDSMALGGGARKNFGIQAQALIAAETSDKANLDIKGIAGASFAYSSAGTGYYPYTITEDLPLRVQGALATALPKWVFVQSGTNGIVIQNHTGAQEYSDFQTYFSALTGLGVTAGHIIVGTMLPRGAGFETERGNFNSAIVSGAAGSGYKLARLDLNANIGAAGANTNTTYFNADAVHPNDTGAGIMARIFKDAMYA